MPEYLSNGIFWSPPPQWKFAADTPGGGSSHFLPYLSCMLGCVGEESVGSQTPDPFLLCLLPISPSFSSDIASSYLLLHLLLHWMVLIIEV
jgi:hypothetical protein